MSGLVKGIKKVFKKVVKFVKKYWKVIVIAAAIYFTAGVALSYFGGTASFASSLPGFGVNGVFSKAATFIGFQGSSTVASGLSMTSGAWLGHAGAAMGTTLTAAEAAAIQAGSSVGAMTASGAHAVVPAGTVSGNVAGAGEILSVAEPVAGAATGAGAGAGAGAGGGAGAGAGATSTTDALVKAMTTATKLQVGTTLIKTAAGLLSPSEEDLIEKKHALEWGQAFGVDRSGNRQFGWGTGQASAPGPAGGGSSYAPQQGYSSQGGGGSMYAAQGGGQSFLEQPYQVAQQSQVPNTQQQDFIVQPQPAGGAA